MYKLLVIILLNISACGSKVAAQIVPANEAGKYIGKEAEVAGYCYYAKILKNLAVKDTVFMLIYLSGIKRKDSDFTIIMKVNKTDVYQFKQFGLEHPNNLSLIPFNAPFDLAAKGTVILFEGKPAVVINENDLGFLTRKD